MNITLHLKTSEYGCVQCYNLVKKEYIGGLATFKKTSFNTYIGVSHYIPHNGSCSSEQLDNLLRHRIKERREKITDLALNNEWEYFITLTFDANNKKYFPNGYSHDVAIQLLKKWINNQHNQNRGMSYLLVSEFHKKGHLHFHGLFKNVPKWKLTTARNPKNNNPIFINGVEIFNLSNYKFGFTTVSKIVSSERVSYYIAKYVSKELVSLPNKNVFWYSHDLKKPNKSYHYIDTTLKNYLPNDYVTYYGSFNGKERSIEYATTKAT